VVPVAVGQALRLAAPVKWALAQPRVRLSLSLLQDLALALVAWAHTGTTSVNRAATTVGYPDAQAFFTVVGVGAVYYLVVFGVTLGGARLLGARVAVQKACVVGGSTKSLLVALALVAILDSGVGEPGFMTLAILVLHFVQAVAATLVRERQPPTNGGG
jgi:predicted Na+-dependent transporter